MNRESEVHFSQIPSIDIKRSTFDRSHSLKTTFSSGKLIPLYVDEVLPGDTINMRVASTVRMSTPVFPVMDNCKLDLFAFFVPNRIVWDHWKEFCGEDTSSSWEQPTNYRVPFMYPKVIGEGNLGRKNFSFGTFNLADYMSIPIVLTNNFGVTQLPFRAYYKIWNEYFRAQAFEDPVYFPTGDSDDTVELLDNIDDYVTESWGNLSCMPVNKYFDYFTSCLPSPQKGQPVLLPLGGIAPVVTLPDDFNLDELGSVENMMRAYSTSNNLFTPYLANSQSTLAVTPIIPSNLGADLSQNSGTTINDLRTAITIQHFMEMQARGGSRYTEIIKTFFGVTSPDARLQRPEYLGGTSIPINVDQVVQTSSSENQPSPLGSTGAFSLTGDKDYKFTYSSFEHGMILILGCVRPYHSYQQGIPRYFSRRDRYDFYYPVFANISEQPVYMKEIYASYYDGTIPVFDDTDKTVFGYQEAWADYRYSQNRITGAFRNNAKDSLSAWHYADFYLDTPYLGRGWLNEDPKLIEKTLAYQGDVNVQFLGDFYFKSEWTRPMPVYSVPGLTRL